MNTQEIASLAERLATTRRTQRMAASMPPGMNELDAWEVQAQAILAFSAECVGYCVVGWTADARRQLGLRTPIYAPIASSHFGPDISLRLPEGAIGVQCELALWLGAPVSCCQDGVVDPAQVANAITAVHPAFGLLGRRTLVTGDSHCAAIADFGLHVATWLGADAHPQALLRRGSIAVSVAIDGSVVGMARQPMDIIQPIVWLAQTLADGRSLNAGDVVTFGCFPIVLQTVAGQALCLSCDGLPPATATLS